MYINEQYHSLPLTEYLSYSYIARDGQFYEKEDPVLTEHLLDIYINEHLTMKLTCIPEYLCELVLGRLLTEGIIKDSAEIKSIYICESGRRAKVILNREAILTPTPYTELTPTCCTGNHILNDYFLSHQKIRPVTPISWKTDWIFSLADRFADGMPLHGQTFATHSCFLAQGNTLLFQCEDIGRHNALDKVIGYALRNHIDLTQCIIYSSGRIPTDMAVKAIRAGIPILASKASPTQEAVQLAKQFHLTLVCAARRDRMKLYAGIKPQ